MDPMNTRMVWLGPTTFYYHRDRSGEVALTPDDNPVLCHTCSDEQVAGGVMERLGEAAQSEQCRCCGRFSWGRYAFAPPPGGGPGQIREAGQDVHRIDPAMVEALLAAARRVTVGDIDEALIDIISEEAERLHDLGDPPVDPGDYDRTSRRLAVLTLCQYLTRMLIRQQQPGESLAILNTVRVIMREVPPGVGEPTPARPPHAGHDNRG